MPPVESIKDSIQPVAQQKEVAQGFARDDAALARLGKKPVLKRNFGFLAILGFSCTILITWEGSLTLFLSGLQNGGPSGILYGYLVVWAGTFSVFATLAELASMAPTSGGQYHWVAMMAPPACRRFLSFLAGWLTLAGWQAATASGAYLTGTGIQGLIILTHPGYLERIQNWHGTLLFWAVLLLGYAINTAMSTLLARFESVVLVFHLLGFFAVIFPLVLRSEHSASEAVWDNWLNLGGWPTQGLSLSIGILGNVFAFVGGDGAIHMSEEVRNPAVTIPWALMIGLSINGILGFAMLVAIMYCMGDINARLEENPIFPFMAIFNNGLGSTAAATVLSSLVILLGFSATTGFVSSTSRVYWAFARDRGLPGWRVLKKVSKRTSIPVYCVITTVVVAIILSLVNIGSATAFTGVISISVAGLFGSYLVAASLLLYRRLTGGIRLPNSDDSLTTDTDLTWGPWHLPKTLGVINNTFTCVYLVYVLFFSFWPSYSQVTPQNMNWSILVFGATILFSVLYYVVWARKTYTGPIVETDG
ncbi:putative amino acid polyamine transporter I [Rosellinia necatrix]|uniref:Putative amino acid polyamine transporter I n=1 Tax=Rosellinia necatrix TaxID=77044 RepID=A0A1S7UNU9_ROSNE|nr:putative amino acid polyamine transporter I [Rosellinia necatrix]